MILSFKILFTKGRTLKGNPTNFKKKILAGEKIHTMREDFGERWKVGMLIHLATGVRSKDYECFTRGEVFSIQKVKIDYDGGRTVPKISIDGRDIGTFETVMLAKNDGFAGITSFLEWFNKSGEYRLIHWTKYTYDGDINRIAAVNSGHKKINEL